MDVSFWAGMAFLRLVTSPEYAEPKTSTVLFSSVSALTADKGITVYASAKSAMNAAVRSAAQELSVNGHRVNTILPGSVDTPLAQEMHPFTNSESIAAQHLLGRGTTEYVSQSVMFLLSDDSCGTTGSNFVVDGGFSA